MRRLAWLVLGAAGLIAAGCGENRMDDGTAPRADDGAAPATMAGATMNPRREMRSETTKSARVRMTEVAMPARRRGTIVKVIGSRFGRVLADGRGEAFYLFDKEGSSRSECYGTCAEAWPPVFARGRPRAGVGARAGLVGTTRRRDGRHQVTYAGRPLYYYVGDSPGVIRCQNVFEFGGRWLVVKPGGAPVT